MKAEDGLKPSQIDTRWKLVRSGLVWFCFMQVTGLSALLLLALLNWLQTSLSEKAGPALFFFSALAFFLFLPQLRQWSQRFIDYLCFPDTANFKAKIETACQVLTELNTRQDFIQYLTEEVPAELQVEKILLHDEPDLKMAGSVTLPLEMGNHSLGFLTIGPKSSGRSFNKEERLALVALQERASLVLSGIQLAEVRAAAEKTDQLKQNFLTNISHVLGTPLNGIINSTGLVADGVLGPLNDEQINFLNQAIRGSEYLMSLLNDILDITRIETGQLRLRLENIDLREVIEEALPMIKGMLQNKPVALEIEIDDLPLVRADRLRIRQILLNLLSNAAKFTKEGLIRVQSWAEGETAFVRVADTGIGIAPEDLPLIFEDYTQAASSPHQNLLVQRRRHLGTGLGMPITQALVELHGGQIWVESEWGQGAEFTFTLPLSSPDSTQTEKPGELVSTVEKVQVEDVKTKTA